MKSITQGTQNDKKISASILTFDFNFFQKISGFICVEICKCL